MAHDDELKSLIESFKGYRDLLVPVQAALRDFADTYDAMRNDISRLDAAFNEDVRMKLDGIYKTLSEQAQHSTDLSSRIDEFVKGTVRYTEDVGRIAGLLSKTEERLASVKELEDRAAEQIDKLDKVIEENKVNNVRDLQRTIESYTSNVQRVGDFINKDVAEALSASGKKLEAIKSDSEKVWKKLGEGSADLEKLAVSFAGVNAFIKKVAESGDVNEAYLFDAFDKWAAARKVKIKK